MVTDLLLVYDRIEIIWKFVVIYDDLRLYGHVIHKDDMPAPIYGHKI
jgi:hypothetical protein